MSTDRVHRSDFLPLLSRGKHRRPGKGACFMEFASHLAGERWSEHPACTPPCEPSSLGRSTTTPPIGHGRRWSDSFQCDRRDRLRSAHRRPDRPATDGPARRRRRAQRITATAVLACERVLADVDGRPAARGASRAATHWPSLPPRPNGPRRFSSSIAISRWAFRRETAPTIVGCAAHGIARSCVPDPDLLLHDMLTEALQECRTLWSPSGPARPTTRVPLADSRPSQPWPTVEPDVTASDQRGRRARPPR
jgi:hypothetical protein